MIDPELWNPWLQLAAHGVTILGIPVAIALFFFQKRRERLEREERAFDELGDAYVEFVTICLAYPELDVFPSAADPPNALSMPQRRQEEAILAILFSLCERVFLSYEGQISRLHDRQREGWEMFMKSHARRANFRRTWIAIGEQFDKRFQKYVSDELLAPDDLSANKQLPPPSGAASSGQIETTVRSARG